MTCLTFSESTESTTSRRLLCRNGSSISFNLSSSDKSPFILASVASSTIWLMDCSGSNLYGLTRIFKCFPIFLKAPAGKEIIITPTVPPIVIAMLGTSRKAFRLENTSFIASLSKTIPNMTRTLAKIKPKIDIKSITFTSFTILFFLYFLNCSAYLPDKF